MKKILSTVLCFALLGCDLQSRAVEGPKPKAEERQVGPQSVVLGLFVLCCVSVGAYLIWRVRQAHPPQGATVTLALDKTYDFATWIPVCTNTVVLTNADWKMMFQQEMTESCAFYKVRLVK